MEKYIVNDFSYDYGVLTTKFSDFEVFLQKLWRLIVDSERDKIYNYVAMTDALGHSLPKSHPDYGRFVAKPKKKSKKDGAVTLKAINALKLGYSVHADKIEEDEKENRHAFIDVFKYACKCTDENSQIFTYPQFKTLYEALDGAHVMQGYGAWYHVKFDEEDESIDEFYKVYIAYVRQRELPIAQTMDLKEVKKAIEDKNTFFITRRSLHKWFKSLSLDKKEQVKQSLNGIKPYEPMFKEKHYHSVSYYAAYVRYLSCRNRSPLFADIREREAIAKELHQPLKLSAEQMSFFDNIFGVAS